MPVSYYPIPEGYIVWRDNNGWYNVAKRPDRIILSASSRTRALTKLYTRLELQKEESNHA